jgi:hypothetical protein
MVVAANTYLLRLSSDLDTQSRRAALMTSTLSEAQLRWGPDDSTWSVAQNFVHLALSYEFYAEQFRHIPPETGRVAKDPFPHSLLGRMLLWVVRPGNSRKFRTSSAFREDVDNANGAVQRFQQSVEGLRATLSAAQNWDLEHRVSTPLGSWARVKVGDALAVAVAHTERHLDQAQRLTELDTFPRTARGEEQLR